jgi:hypothetical protein
MRWHAERNKPAEIDESNEKEPELMLRHPSDASQWKALDFEHPSFGNEPRNIRLGASTHGLNPFGNQSSTHSSWHVFVWMYNLPPWLCMKRKYIHMSMLIEGPKQLGNDIQLYLQLLKEELDMLWDAAGVNTWDAYADEYFPMKAALIMTQILPVALRGIMDPHIRETIFGLCNFFDCISRKSISEKQVVRLQEEIVVILNELEMYFPPAFFDIMVHLLVHIVDDIIHLGPPFLHSMMPFKRMNGVIKGYVHNRARPDGSIAKDFLTEECVSFCTNYLNIENPVGMPGNKHLGRLSGAGHRVGKRELHVDDSDRCTDFDRANLLALQHLEVVDPWLEKHRSSIAKKYSELGQHRTDVEITKEHNTSFTRWFKCRLQDNPPSMTSAEGRLLFFLSQGPACNLMTYKAYDINGYTFYTEEKDRDSDYQNSGVTMESFTDDVKERYYGRIEEIWELDYCGEKVPMFRVRWAKSVRKADRYFTTMCIPEAKFTKSATANVIARTEPWVLATKVDQCFFITDPTMPSRVVMRREKRSIIGMDGVANEEDFDQYGDPKIEDDDDDEETYTTRRSRTTLPKRGLPYLRRSAYIPGLNYSTATKKGKKIVKR